MSRPLLGVETKGRDRCGALVHYTRMTMQDFTRKNVRGDAMGGNKPMSFFDVSHLSRQEYAVSAVRITRNVAEQETSSQHTCCVLKIS